MYVPRAYALDGNRAPAIVAGLVLLACPVGRVSLALAGLTLLGAYVVGPAAGYLLWLGTVTVDDALVEFTTEGEA